MKVKIKKPDDMRSVIINSIAVGLVFTAIVSIIIIALFMFNTRGEFVSVLEGELAPSPSFYISAISVIIVSSILYTPFSYGISNYFINSKNGCAQFSQIFYLFKQPALMFKAIMSNILKKVIKSIWHIIILIVAVLVECGIFTVSVLVNGQNIFDFEQNFLQNVMAGIISTPIFITLTVIEWCGVIILFIYINIRYIMCKYVLICYPKAGIMQTIRIGEYAIAGNVTRTVGFYVKYLSIFIFTFITLGLGTTLAINRTGESFSSYAVRAVRSGFERYCDLRNVKFK